MLSTFVRGALGAAALTTLSSAALSHAVLERREAQAGAPYRGVIQIAHGCAGSPTVSLRLILPEGALSARPMAKPGWTVDIKTGPYARPYQVGHDTVSAGVKEITWSGSRLPNEFFDEFVFSARLSDELKPGELIYFPVEQICETGEARWVEIPAAGQDPKSLRRPAPAVRIVAAVQNAAAPAGAGTVKVGDLAIEQPWMRATPGGAKVAGGYVRITNHGSAPDRLLAASIPIAAHGEVHEMLMDGGVMKMRPVEGGIEIKPGQTVELKPGGYHLMFMDLTAPVAEGASQRGTLTFARAGTVEVTFAVAGIGARGAPEDPHANH